MQKHTGKGLDIESFERYAERDGPAFMYANSFNENIWCAKMASERLEGFWRNLLFYPKDPRDLYENREKCVKDAAAKEAIKPKDAIEELGLVESRAIGAIGDVRTELGQFRALLEAQIMSVKRWLIWGFIIVVVLFLLRN